MNFISAPQNIFLALLEHNCSRAFGIIYNNLFTMGIWNLEKQTYMFIILKKKCFILRGDPWSLPSVHLI
jgi:hypothetical protein